MASEKRIFKLLLSLYACGICYIVFGNELSKENLRLHLFRKTDPDTYLNTSQLITSKGYPCLEYTVETDDGYLIYIYRIPYGIKSGSNPIPSRDVVILQHGLICSSSDWVLNLANQSLGFILADAGFDVWLGNVRGNTYGLRHKSIDPSNSSFWEFSWDEIAEFDFPAIIKKVLKITRQPSLYYIGHSQGTLMAFAYLSEKKDLNQKIKKFIALAPVTTVGHMRSPLRLLAPFADDLEFLFHLLGQDQFLPSSHIIKLFSQTLCKDAFIQILCEDVLFLIAGFDPDQLNITRLPVYTAHTPAGTSTQNIIHFIQMVASKKFIKYDYGSAKKNQEKYGQPVPPQYFSENVTLPVAVFWGENDYLADPKDVKTLVDKLPNLIGPFKASLPKWNHLDYLYGIDAARVVYDQVLKLLTED